MSETPAQRALTASTVALVVGVAGVAMFLPPLHEHTTASVLRTVLVAAAMAVSIPLHWVFLAIAARRMKRSVTGWLLLAVLLFPIGGAAALILLSWFSGEGDLAASGEPAARRL
jgi:hypothetical protein